MNIPELTLLQTITIPEYPVKIQLTKTRRPKYYTEKDLPKKYKTLVESGKYSFDKRGRLINESKKLIIKNEAFIDKPRFLTLSGNNIISGYDTPHKRAIIARHLHSFFEKHIKQQLKPFKEEDYPLYIEWDFYTTVDPKVEWDPSNLFFYYKYFEDSLTNNNIIKDDNWKYIVKPGNAPYVHIINNFEERKFVFRFYSCKNKNTELITHIRNL